MGVGCALKQNSLKMYRTLLWFFFGVERLTQTDFSISLKPILRLTQVIFSIKLEISGFSSINQVNLC